MKKIGIICASRYVVKTVKKIAKQKRLDVDRVPLCWMPPEEGKSLSIQGLYAVDYREISLL